MYISILYFAYNICMYTYMYIIRNRERKNIHMHIHIHSHSYACTHILCSYKKSIPNYMFSF